MAGTIPSTHKHIIRNNYVKNSVIVNRNTITCSRTLSQYMTSPAKWFRQLRAANETGLGPLGGLAIISAAAKLRIDQSPFLHLWSSHNCCFPELCSKNTRIVNTLWFNHQVYRGFYKAQANLDDAIVPNKRRAPPIAGSNSELSDEILSSHCMFVPSERQLVEKSNDASGTSNSLKQI